MEKNHENIPLQSEATDFVSNSDRNNFFYRLRPFLWVAILIVWSIIIYKFEGNYQLPEVEHLVQEKLQPTPDTLLAPKKTEIVDINKDFNKPAVIWRPWKVNQHFNLEKKQRQTDDDWVSWINSIDLSYCRKFYSKTVSLQKSSYYITLFTWCEEYNKNCFHVGTKQFFECIQP